jgi:hypothetical protein
MLVRGQSLGLMGRSDGLSGGAKTAVRSLHADANVRVADSEHISVGHASLTYNCSVLGNTVLPDAGERCCVAAHIDD